MTRTLKTLSTLIWAAVGLFFGLGLVLAGAQALPRPAGVLTLCVGLLVIAMAYGLHKLTCWGLNKSQRSSAPA